MEPPHVGCYAELRFARGIFGLRTSDFGLPGRLALFLRTAWSRMRNPISTIAKTIKNHFPPTLLVVQCAGLRHMAYRDRKGRLRDFWNQKVLPLPIHVL